MNLPAHRRRKPPLRVFTTTLWEYPSQHYADTIQGDKNYAGATPSWVIWQLLTRYTRESDLVIDPMVGSGTTLDVARDLNRRALGFDLNPQRDEITLADARQLPLDDHTADFAFIDPPYSTHITYSDDPRCIGTLDAGADDNGRAYYDAMALVIADLHRVLKNRRYLGLYVSDSFKKGKPFMPIGFELFALLRQHFTPIDIVAVVRQNAKLARGNWHKAAEQGNFFLRGFNYLFIMKKDDDARANHNPAPTRARTQPEIKPNPNATSTPGAKPDPAHKQKPKQKPKPNQKTDQRPGQKKPPATPPTAKRPIKREHPDAPSTPPPARDRPRRGRPR